MLYDLKFFKSASFQTIFEPASGHGNFGIEILNYKFKKVIKEMKNDNVSDDLWTKEYEIRSLIALSSLYQNDIDKQNIQELKSRLYRFTINQYKKYSKNKYELIPTHYDVAVSNILSTNCIHANMLDSQKRK